MLELFQPSRKLLLLLAASLMPACIIPVGPDWQPPPGEENRRPEIIDAVPFFGAEVTSGGMVNFSITVSDANGDAIFVRWFAGSPDQPLFRKLRDSTPRPPTDGPVPRPIPELFDCSDFSDLPSHLTILAVVADRDFLIGGPTRTSVEDGGLLAYASWTLNFPCPSSSSP